MITIKNASQIAKMREAGALLEVADAEQVAAAVSELWINPAQAEQMRAAGLAVMQRNQGALQRLIEGLTRLL